MCNFLIRDLRAMFTPSAQNRTISYYDNAFMFSYMFINIAVIFCFQRYTIILSLCLFGFSPKIVSNLFHFEKLFFSLLSSGILIIIRRNKEIIDLFYLPVIEFKTWIHNYFINMFKTCRLSFLGSNITS